jgi:uncharacterized membrane protein YccC
MVASVVPLATAGLQLQVVRGVNRILGTMGGLLLAWGLLLVPMDSIAVVLVLAVLQALTELLVARHYGLALLFITPLALLVTQRADPQQMNSLLQARLLETIIGVSVGLLVAVATRDRAATAAWRDP